MSSQLKITKSLVGDTYVVVAEVLDGATIPKEIFSYENTGTDELGDFCGVVNVEELTRFQIWKGVSIPKFGNKFLRHDQAKIEISSELDPNEYINQLIASIKRFSLEYQSQTDNTQILQIP